MSGGSVEGGHRAGVRPSATSRFGSQIRLRISTMRPSTFGPYLCERWQALGCGGLSAEPSPSSMLRRTQSSPEPERRVSDSGGRPYLPDRARGSRTREQPANRLCTVRGTLPVHTVDAMNRQRSWANPTGEPGKIAPSFATELLLNPGSRAGRGATCRTAHPS